MSQRLHYFVWIALLIAFVMLFARLGELPLRDPDEGRNSEVAREMNQSGAWLIPTYNGLTYLDKPAFFFRLVATSFGLFGESEATARLPSALFAAGLLLMTFAFCRREYGDLTGSLAVIIIATSPLFMVMARHVIFDMTLAFFVCASIFAGYFAEGTTGRARRLWYLFGAAMGGFATLVKGPVGFLLPILVLVVFNIMDGRKGWLGRYAHPFNFLVFFAIVLPWFFGVSYYCPDFPHYGLVEESFHRFTTNSFQRSGPIYYYGIVLLIGLFAWSLLLPEAVVAAVRQRLKWSRADRLLIVWSVVLLVFFSISKSKLPHYILTLSVALGVLLARLFVSALQNNNGLAARIVFRGLIILAVFSAVLAGLLGWDIYQGAHDKFLGFHSRDIERIGQLFGPMTGVLLVMAVVAVIGRSLRNLRVALLAFLILPISLLTVSFNGLLHYSEASSSRQIAQGIPPLPAGTQIACLECFPNGLPFYLKRNITLVTHDGIELSSNYVLSRLKKDPTWPNVLVSLATVNQWVAGQTQPLFLLTNNRSQSDLAEIASAHAAQLVPIAPGWWGVLLQPAGH